MIRSMIYLSLILCLSGTIISLLFWSHFSTIDFINRELPAQKQLVRVLSLTDMALWTEARYTRHPAMADLFSPFQDHPASFEHFPAGALLTPSGPRPETTLIFRHKEQL